MSGTQHSGFGVSAAAAARRRTPIPNNNNRKKRRASDACRYGIFEFYDRLREHVTDDINRTDAIELKEKANNCGIDPFYLRHFTLLNSYRLANGKPRQHHVDAAGAALLAVHHFNNGIANVVPQLADYADNCSIKFTIEYMNSETSPIKGSRDLIDKILPRKKMADPSLPFPTALVGAARSAVSEPLAILTGIHALPQISYASTSTVFDNKDQFPLFGRLIPSAIGDANAAVDYLHNILSVTHLGVLFVRDPYGSTYAQAIQDAARRIVPPVQVRLSSFAKDEEIVDAVRQLKVFGFKYFVGVLFDSNYEKTMSEAYRQGIAGEGYFWMFGDGVIGIHNAKFHAVHESGLVNATHGSAVIAAANPSTQEGRPEFMNFMNYWKNLSTPEMLAYFNSKMSEGFMTSNEGQTNCLTQANTSVHSNNMNSSRTGAPAAAEQANSIDTAGEYSSHESCQVGVNRSAELTGKSDEEVFGFSDIPGPFSLLQYDTIISLAFAACDAAQKETFFDGEMFYQSFLQTSFNGLYGNVAIDEKTGSRKYTTLPYSVSNFIANPIDDSGKVSFQLKATDVFQASGTSADVMEWQTIRPFVFSGGASEPPDVLPPNEIDIEMISIEARIFGLVLCGISLLLPSGFAIWTAIHRNNEIVKASQPIFLGMLCLGGLILGSAIIPMSLQEPIPQQGLNVACLVIPWLCSFGFIIAFSGLFSKTMRVNEMFRSRGGYNTVAVKIQDVMKPFIFLFFANLTVLISWTLVSPLTYQHIPKGSVDEFDRPSKYYATCAPVDVWWADWLFVGLWGALNISALLFANFQAYQGRCILTEYSESEYIGISMAILLQAFIIGVPVIVVVHDSPTARYVVQCCLVFVTVIAVILPIFIPKVFFLRKWREHEKKVQQKILLGMKKQRQMDALKFGDGSLTSWYAQQIAGSSKNSEPSQEGQHEIGLEIVGKYDSNTGDPGGTRRRLSL